MFQFSFYFIGLLKDGSRILRDVNITSGCKMMVVGSTINDVLTVTPPAPSQLKEEKAATGSQPSWAENLLFYGTTPFVIYCAPIWNFQNLSNNEYFLELHLTLFNRITHLTIYPHFRQNDLSSYLGVQNIILSKQG